MKQTNNKNGSKADPLSIDYIYRLEMKMANILDEVVNDVELTVLSRVRNFKGPKNVSVTEFQEFEVSCSADGKPPPTLTMVIPNGKKKNETKTLNQDVTAYRNMTGMYNCSAENEVTARQIKSAWINVSYLPEMPATFYAKPSTVCKGYNVNLTCANAIANPPVDNYTLHDANGILANSTSGYFKRQAMTIGENTFWCFPWNDVGRGKNASTKVNIVGPPNITLYKNNTVPLPEPVVVVEGEDVNVTFSYSGQLYVTWEKLSGSQTSGQTFKDNLTYGLMFTPVNRNHSGTYRVTVRDTNGCVNSRTFILSIRYGPKGRFSCSREIRIKEGDDGSWFCKASANPPPVYSVSHQNKTISNMSSGNLKNIPRKSNGSFITCLVSNKINSDTCAIRLIVTYLHFKCNETKILKPSGPDALFNVDAEAYPEPTLFVHSASGNRISETDCVSSNWTCKIPKTNSHPYILYARNDAGSRRHKLSISSRSTEKIFDADFEIKGKEIKDLPEVEPVMQELLKNAYYCNPNITKVEIKGFKAGSLFMNFRLTIIDDMEDYLQPLRNAMRDKPSLDKGMIIGDIKLGGYHEPATTSKDWKMIIIIILVVVVLLLVLAIVLLIIWYCKKKRSDRKKLDLEDNTVSMEMHDRPMDDEPRSRDNEGYSQSHYAERGLSHTESACKDKVERVQDGGKDKNNNSTQPASETTEPTYAVVDRRPIMQNADTTTSDTALGDLDGQDTEIAKGQEKGGSEQKSDSKKETGTEVKQKPPDNQEVKPLNKEHSGKEESDSKKKTGTEEKEIAPDNQEVKPLSKEHSGKKESDSKKKTGTEEKENAPDNQEVQPLSKEHSGKEESDSKKKTGTDEKEKQR